jgi:hypothetical protein
MLPSGPAVLSSRCFPSRSLILSLLLATPACSYWKSVPTTPGPVGGPRQTIEAWQKGRRTQLREATVAADTLRGLVVSGSGTLTTLLLPVAEIDSLRVRHPPGIGGILLLTAGVGVMGLVVLAAGIRD